MSDLVATYEQILRWKASPLTMVRELFETEPDAWQHEALEVYPVSPRLAMKACKGPGKTAVLAWIGWNFLLTRPHPKIGAISITAQNLADGLWTEMAKWQSKSELLKARFVWQKQRIFAKDHPETWFMAAKSWAQTANREDQAKALAGFHADYVMFLVDESGGMPDAVMASAEAAFGGTIECHIIQAGNPTNLEGPLYRAAVTNRDLWRLIEITGDPDDPKRTPRIPVEFARQQITQYGRNHPYVLVNIFGQFPPSSFSSLIGPDEVEAAMKRTWRPHDIASSPKVMGIDVARYGDDASVIIKRQGLQMMTPIVHRNINGLQGAGVTQREWTAFNADACFIDNGGGYGASWIDQLHVLGRTPVPVDFGGAPHDMAKYENKRVEMAMDFVAWIRMGGAMPHDTEILAALTKTTYTFTKGGNGSKMILEPKKLVKEKLGYSPDKFDAAILTFAEPVAAKGRAPLAPRHHAPDGYNPFAEADASGYSPGRASNYDPFR